MSISIRMRAARVIAVLLLAGGLAACAPQSQQNYKELGGAVLGGGLGALAGSTIGSGRGRVVAAGVGGVLGAMLGAEVGRSLDRADRSAAEQAQYRALEYTPAGQSVAWNNPQSGNHGYVRPTQTYQQANRVCREYEHTVYIDGRAETAYGTACRSPDGRWQIV